MLLGAVLLSTATQAAQHSCEKTVRWNDDPPHAFKAPDGRLIGIIPDEVNEVMTRLGCRVHWVDMPWGRALVELQSGRLDMLPGALRTREREAYAYFSIPGPRSDNYLFMSTQALTNFKFTKLSELRGSNFRLGAQIGVTYGRDYDELLRDTSFAPTVQLVSSRELLWRMLQAGRIDGLIADEQVGPQEIQQFGLQDKVKRTAIVLPDEGTALAFSKRSVEPAFVERYNQALVAMHRDGTFIRIARRYNAVK